MTAQSFLPALPEWPLTMLLRTLPDSVHVEILSRLFNHLLRGQSIAERLPELNAKRICLTFTDTRSALHFRIEQGCFRRQSASTRDTRGWDVRISGTLHDFLLLATRREDPDTLFFNRRLNIEGDTETGLHVKNLLDALDYDVQAHLDAVLGARFGRLASDMLRRSGAERFLSGIRLS
jgi:predicted lipid carrier protein YhbT